MANITEARPFSRIEVAAPKISARFWMRLLAGSLGALVCAVGAAVAVFHCPDSPADFLFAKFLLGVLVFTAGFVIARSGSQPPSCELHFDPKYGEFILVPTDEDWQAAQCVMSTKIAQVDVSGRYLSVASQDERLKINIAMENARSAFLVSKSCQSLRGSA